MDFVDGLIHSFKSSGESGLEDGDRDPSLAGDTAAYMDHDSASEEEMEFPQPLCNTPLSDSASRQVIVHFALVNHLSYAAVD